MPRKNILGQRFGKLIVAESTQEKSRKEYLWICACSCGGFKKVTGSDLKGGRIKSCGCLRGETLRGIRTKHGKSESSIFSIWTNMQTRCLNKNSPGYELYGARGIKICDEWLVFENFYRDMGDRPVGKSLDRINNDGNYEPSNCRWATPKEQANNRRPRRPNKKLSN